MPKRTVYIPTEDDEAISRYIAFQADSKPEFPRLTYSQAIIGLARAQLSFQRKMLLKRKSGSYQNRGNHAYPPQAIAQDSPTFDDYTVERGEWDQS